MNKAIVNWGVISCAGIADKAVIPGIKSAANAKLYAISSRSKDKLEDFGKRHNPVKTYESYDEMLNDPDIDAVYIPLPNGLHCEWVIKAAQKKKHVLCEKPLGVTAQEVLTMKEACERHGVLLMEAFAYRHSPLTLQVKKMVDDGAIGKLKFIESNFSFILTDPTNVRLMKSLTGGAAYDIGCYNINQIRYIAGSEPLSIQAVGEVGQESGVDETSCTLMHFVDGLTAVSYCSFKAKEKCDYTVVGDKGFIQVPVQFNSKGTVKIFVTTDKGTEEIQIDCPDNYMLEVKQFGRCILQGEKPLLTLEDSFHNARVIDETLKQIFKK